tara:strand:+ start:3102 stop:3584 length:483 start_codon:yes stop_codon:yes gene_type:complete
MVCKTCASESKSEQAKARKRPGGSNVGSYPSRKGSIFAGPAGGAPKGSFPLTRNGRLSLDRAKSAIKLAHNAPRPTALKKFVANTLIKTKGNKMASLGKKILGKLATKDTEKKWGGNKGDESSSKRDYANFKDTDKGYKSKAFGEGHGDRSKSRRDYKRK